MIKIDWKILLLVVALLGNVALLGRASCQNYQLEAANAQLNEQLMKADLELGRAHTQFGDTNEKIKELEAGIQKEIAERDAVATMYAELEARYKVASKFSGQVTEEKLGEPMDPLGAEIFPNQLYVGTDDLKIRSVYELGSSFDDGRLQLNVALQNDVNDQGHYENAFVIAYALNLKMRAKLVETHTPSGAVNHYAEVYEIDKDGKEVGKFELEKFEVVVEMPNQASWYWWAPHVDIGALVMADLTPNVQFGGSIGFSVFGYGLTKNDLSLRVLRASLDITDMPGFGLTPVQYNLGQFIPVISNLWIGPHITWTFGSGWQFGGLISAVL